MSGFPQIADDMLSKVLLEYQPVIILARPQMAENIGATARAMLNCGLCTLRIVDPRDGWPNEAAYAMASGADAVLDHAVCFSTIEEAIADCHYVFAMTARLRDIEKKVTTVKSGALNALAHIQQKQRVAVLFGAERAGLTNDDIALAHEIISVPLNPAFKSLNLAQSVLLFAYEFFQVIVEKMQNEEELSIIMGESETAPQGEIDAFVQRLIPILEEKKFFTTPEQRPVMLTNLKNMFYRTHFTSQEMRTLHGVITALLR